MNTTFSRWGSVALALCLNLLAGCAYRGGDVAGAAAEPVSAGYSASQGQASGREAGDQEWKTDASHGAP